MRRVTEVKKKKKNKGGGVKEFRRSKAEWNFPLKKMYHRDLYFTYTNIFTVLLSNLIIKLTVSHNTM